MINYDISKVTGAHFGESLDSKSTQSHINRKQTKQKNTTVADITARFLSTQSCCQGLLCGCEEEGSQTQDSW